MRIIQKCEVGCFGFPYFRFSNDFEQIYHGKFFIECAFGLIDHFKGVAISNEENPN